MRISDWSSDVCSSDLAFSDALGAGGFDDILRLGRETDKEARAACALGEACENVGIGPPAEGGRDRKSVGEGKSVSVRVDLGGRRIIKKKNNRDIIINRTEVHISESRVRKQKIE